VHTPAHAERVCPLTRRHERASEERVTASFAGTVYVFELFVSTLSSPGDRHTGRAKIRYSTVYSLALTHASGTWFAVARRIASLGWR